MTRLNSDPLENFEIVVSKKTTFAILLLNSVAPKCLIIKRQMYAYDHTWTKVDWKYFWVLTIPNYILLLINIFIVFLTFRQDAYHHHRLIYQKSAQLVFVSSIIDSDSEDVIQVGSFFIRLHR